MVKKSLGVLGIALALHGIAHAAKAKVDSDASAAAQAAAQALPHPSTWAAKGQLGLILARGNTTAESGNASFDAAHAMGRWTLSGGFAALYASTNGVSTQQDLTGHFQADRALGERTFWFGTARYDRNLFSGFAYQESVASGGGFNFLNTSATTLSGELGVGYRRERPEDLTKGPLGNVISRGAPQAVVNDAVLHAALKYEHTVTSTTKVSNTLLVESGSSDTMTSDNLSVQVKVDESLSLAVGMQLRNNTSPPRGNIKHTDTVMTVNLVYELKNSKLSATAPTAQFVSDLNLFDLP